MKPKKAIKELEKQLRKDQHNLVLRLKLAAVYREVGRTADAVQLYGSVAVAYHQQGRLAQAIAVCKSVLEIEPSHPETQKLLAELDRMRAERHGSEPGVGGGAIGNEIAAAARPAYFEPDAGGAPPRSYPPPAHDPPAPLHPQPQAPPQPQPRHQPQASPHRHPPAQAPPPPALDDLGPERPMPSLAAVVPPKPPPRESPARQHAAKEFSGRSGMTPHSEPNPFGPGGRIAGPQERRNKTSSTQRMTKPPEHRGSSHPLLTPTPLPRPLALHDHDRSSSDMRPSPPPLAPPEETPPPSAPPSPRRRSPYRNTLLGRAQTSGATPPPIPKRPPKRPPTPLPAPSDPAPDDDAPTRIADELSDGSFSRLPDAPPYDDEPSQASDDAQTTISPEIISSIDIADADADAVADDAPTRIADQSGAWPGATAEAEDQVASVFDRDTRPIAEVDRQALEQLRRVGAPPPDAPAEMPGASASLDPVDDEEPTNPPIEPGQTPAGHAPARQLSPIPPELRAFQRGSRLLDVEPEWTEEPTDPRADDAEPTNPGARSAPAAESAPAKPMSRRTTKPLPSEQEPPEHAPADRSLRIRRAFVEPFSETLSALAPDGSTIDAPLSLFNDLPDAALAELSRGMVMRRFESGEIVIREGDPGDACYIIATGEVRILKTDPTDPQGDLLEVARLGAGSLFGEFALLADRRRHATVQATETSDIYEIPRRLLRELAATFPDVGPTLESFYRERLLATLLVTAPFFQPISEERRGDLLARFRPMHSESGQAIIREGERAGGLYLIVLGSVEITKRVSDKRSVLLATLGEGAYFGEMSLLKGGVASATVTAAGPTELAMLPPKDFYAIVSRNPILWDEVRREANRRQLEMNQLVTGETNVV